MKRSRRYIFLVGLVLIVTIQACASVPEEAPAEEPAASMSTEMPIPTATLGLLPPDEQDTAPPAIPEQRRLTLEWPPVIRAGDADIVRLTLEVDDMGNIIPTAEIDGHEVGGEVVSIPNLYETHHVIAEARMDMAGVQILPADTVSEPLLPGESVTFYWSVSPAEAGNYRGTVWLYLRFVPKDGGEEMRRTISSQLIDIRSTTLFGIKFGSARFLGILGSFIGTVLGFPFVDDLFKWLWKRMRR